MTDRKSTISRQTKETNIDLELDIDGNGQYSIETGIPFFNHMLTLFSHHGMFNLKLDVKGDIEVDFHHSVEDVGICLGQAFNKAIKEARGIQRYASGLIPMDEALCQIAIDISNRPFLNFNCDFPKTKVGAFDLELAEEFFIAFVNNARITMHLQLLSGSNLHHMIEACFKAFGVCLNQATLISTNKKHIPSTKGVL